ncbi:MAG TPA: hypothetical protein VGW33_07230 [Terriglobia bacterium]|nr:hypothetical protein [Terriglobia bacterium]
MKKLLAVVFTLALALSIAAPVFAQDSSAPAQTDSSMKKEKKMKKHHMMKKAKKEKKMKKDKMAKPADTTTPPQQ